MNSKTSNEMFKKDLDEYEMDFSPVKSYLSQTAMYVSLKTGLSKEDAIVYVKSILKKSNINNPNVRYRKRKDNGDRTTLNTPLTNYIADSIKDEEIIAPSLTTYDNPKNRQSFHSTFLTDNIKKRSIVKKIALKFKQDMINEE